MNWRRWKIRFRAKPLQSGIVFFSLGGTLFALGRNDAWTWFYVGLSACLLLAAGLESRAVSHAARKAVAVLRRTCNCGARGAKAVMEAVVESCQRGLARLNRAVAATGALIKETLVLPAFVAAVGSVYVSTMTGLEKLHGAGEVVFLGACPSNMRLSFKQ